MKQQQQPRSPESDVAEGTGAQRGPFLCPGFVSFAALAKSRWDIMRGSIAVGLPPPMMSSIIIRQIKNDLIFKVVMIDLNHC